MSLTNDQITAKNFKDFYDYIKPYLGIVHAGFTPVGTIIQVAGVDAPVNYVKCDGSVYNLTDYPELANYFESQYGSKNHFGGNGTSTFAVPSLSGASADVIYCIAVNSIPTDRPPLTLSEQEAGTWIDGKTIYQKVFEIPVPSASSAVLAESLVNVGAEVDTYVDVKGFMDVDGWVTGIPWGLPGLSTVGVILSAYTNSDTSGSANKVGVMYQGDITIADSITVIAQYTKAAVGE